LPGRFEELRARLRLFSSYPRGLSEAFHFECAQVYFKPKPLKRALSHHVLVASTQVLPPPSSSGCRPPQTDPLSWLLSPCPFFASTGILALPGVSLFGEPTSLVLPSLFSNTLLRFYFAGADCKCPIYDMEGSLSDLPLEEGGVLYQYPSSCTWSNGPVWLFYFPRPPPPASHPLVKTLLPPLTPSFLRAWFAPDILSNTFKLELERD